MSYTFTPLTEDQLSDINLLCEGTYSFEVIKSDRKVSNAGNPMAALQIKVYDDFNNKTSIIFDYLVFSQIPLNIKKIKHFCETTGLIEEYKNGTLPEELDRLTGKVNIGIKAAQPNPSGGSYPKKNIVVDYFVGPKSEVRDLKAVPQVKSEDPFNDDVPF